jgi:hypothetical protein
VENTEKEGATEKPVARMIHPGKDIPLQFPIEFDGMLYEKAHVRVASAKEIRSFMVKASSAEDGELLVPIGVDLPQEVWDALSMDDQEAISEAVDAFTPARLKEAFERASKTGESTSE